MAILRLIVLSVFVTGIVVVRSTHAEYALGSSAPIEGGCESDGLFYKKGDAWSCDCNTCWCNGNDIVMSTLMACIHFEVEDPILLPFEKKASRSKRNAVGRTVRIEGGCESNGLYFNKGDSWRCDCNTCWCNGNDIVGSTLMACIHIDRNPHLFEVPDLVSLGEVLRRSKRNNYAIGSSVPIEDGCESNGLYYNKGDRWRCDCNRCWCDGNNRVGSTMMACMQIQEPTQKVELTPFHIFGKAVRRSKRNEYAVGSSAPIEGGCESNGLYYDIGDRWRCDCNYCGCVGEDIVWSTLMACVHFDVEEVEAVGPVLVPVS